MQSTRPDLTKKLLKEKLGEEADSYIIIADAAVYVGPPLKKLIKEGHYYLAWKSPRLTRPFRQFWGYVCSGP